MKVQNLNVENRNTTESITRHAAGPAQHARTQSRTTENARTQPRTVGNPKKILGTSTVSGENGEGEKKKPSPTPKKLSRKEKKREYLESLKEWRKRNSKHNGRKLQKGKIISWNCDTMQSNHRVLAAYLAKKKILLCALQETREHDFVHRNQGEYVYISTAAIQLPSGGWSGGVGFMVHHSCKIRNYEELHRNILRLEVEMGGEKITPISAYAPQDRKKDPEGFWKTIRETAESTKKQKRTLFGIDANGRLGKNAHEDFNEVGPNVLHEKTTNNGNKLLKAIEGQGFKVANTFFKKKKDQPLHTYECGVVKSQIDFIVQKGLNHQRSGWAIKDCHPDPMMTMNKPCRTHYPVVAKLQRIRVQGIKNHSEDDFKGYDRKEIARAINEEAEDIRKKPQKWGFRRPRLTDSEDEGEDGPNLDEEKAKFKKLEETYSAELRTQLASHEEGQIETQGAPSDTRAQENALKKDPIAPRAERRARLKVLREKVRGVHKISPTASWEEQSLNIKKMVESIFPKERTKRRTWHGVAISEKTARVHDNMCRVEEKLVRVIQDSPRRPEVFLKIQRLKDEIKSLRAAYEKYADEDEQAFYLERAEELNRGNTQERDNKAWALVQTILKKQGSITKKRTTCILDNSNKKCWSPEEKAKAFGEFIKDNFTEKQELRDTDEWWATVEEKSAEDLPTLPSKNNISTDTRKRLEAGLTKNIIKTAIGLQARGKASGPDQLAVEIFQTAPDYWATRLLAVFQNPPEMHQLQDGRVAYCYKNKGSTTLRTFYRPISVLNVAYKIWALGQTILTNEIVGEVMSTSQAGFRQKHGTRDALSWNQHMINRVEEKLLSMGYLDMSKAFDKAIRRKIWERLIKIGCPKSWVSQLREGHKNSHLRPSFEGAVGEKVQVTKGVYQGSPLSPVLFIVYSQAFNILFEEECDRLGLKSVKITDAPRFPLSEKPWEKVYDVELEWLSTKDRKIRFTAYADDTVLICNTLEELKKAITAFEKACDEYGMEINKGKTEVQTREKIEGEERKAFNEGFLGAKRGVDCVKDNLRLLGEFTNINGYTKPSVLFRLNQARKIWGSLRKPFFMVKKIKLRTRLLVYQALVVSTMMFGTESFALSYSDLATLQTFQNKCLRDIYDTDSAQMRKFVLEEDQVNGSAEIVVPKNVEIQEKCQTPTIRSRYKWQVLNFTTHWVRNTNLSTMVNKLKLEGEKTKPKEHIKGQAKNKEININSAMEELAQRYKRYREIILDEKWISPEGTREYEKAGETLEKEGFCHQEKVCSILPEEKQWDPAVIGPDFPLANESLQERWMVELDAQSKGD